MTAVRIMAGIYLMQVGILLWVAYSKQFFKAYTGAKASASCGFIILAATAWLNGGMHHTGFFIGLFLCLLLCLGGDVLLGLADNREKFFSRYFLKGVGCFMAAHIGLCALFSTVSPLRWYDFVVPLLLAVITFICGSSKWFELKRMRYPAVLYALLVGLMCTKSFGVCFALQMSTRGKLLALGSGLFLLSDIIILFLYFYVKKKAWMRGVNLFTYYMGVMFIALSCACP